MRYTRLLCILAFAFTPLAGLADDQDLGPAIYLNNAPSSSQMDSDWDDTATTDDDTTSGNTVYAAKPQPKKRTYGPTKNEDHIWSLAEKLRPDTSVTIQQMIIALQRANPNAFDQGNINALKHGSILTIPALTKIQAISPETAILLVQQQNQQWQQAQNSGMYFKVDNGIVSSKPTALIITNTKPSTPISVKQQVTPSPIISSKSTVAKNSSTTPNVNTQITKINPAIPKTITTIDAKKSAINLPLIKSVNPVKNEIAQPTVAAATNNSTVEVQNLEKELAADQKDFQNYRNQMTEQVQQLEQENATMQKQLATEKNALNNLKENIVAKPVNTTVIVPASATDNGFTSYLPKTKTGWWILWGALFLIVLLWLPSPRKKAVVNSERQEPSLSNDEELDNKDIKDEYDFMNSLEAMPAKLDLARAYLDMDDYPSAENLLKKIIKKGNDAERKRARQMLREAKSLVP